MPAWRIGRAMTSSPRTAVMPSSLLAGVSTKSLVDGDAVFTRLMAVSRVDRPSSFAELAFDVRKARFEPSFGGRGGPRRIWHQTRTLARSAGCPGIKGPVPPPVSMVRLGCRRIFAMSISSCGWKDIFSSDTTTVDAGPHTCAPCSSRWRALPSVSHRPARPDRGMRFAAGLGPCGTRAAALAVACRRNAFVPDTWRTVHDGIFRQWRLAATGVAGTGVPGLGHQSAGRACATAPERAVQRGLPRRAAVTADA